MSYSLANAPPNDRPIAVVSDHNAAPRKGVMSEVAYTLVDVFTTHRFGGNPLAVFPDARRIPDGDLQRIARELNLSETAFAYCLAPGEWRLRIFTPTMEHRFAGHPTIGAALVLAEQDKLRELVLHEAVGPVAVTIDRPTGSPPVARLAVPTDPEERDVTIPLTDLASLLTLQPDDLRGGARRARAMSCGVPFLFVRVRDAGTLARACLRRDVWSRLLADTWAPHVYVYAVVCDDGTPQVRSRMFAPLMGIEEDPATGGAAAALAGVFAADDPQTQGVACWTILQGVEMGRPSLLELSAHLEGGKARQISVGGSAVRMGRGALLLAASGEE